MKTHTERMDCRSCRFRMQHNDGCYKFGLSFKEIDSGTVTAHTKEYGSIIIGRDTCPYANGRRQHDG